MKVGALTLMIALLLAWPALAGPTNTCVGGDQDSDGHVDVCDNCLTAANVSQTDADSDGCGNVCDADFDQSGLVAIGDFSSFATAYGTSSPVHDIGMPDPPQPDGTVAIADFSRFAQLYGKVPGPSGTASGTTACP